MLCELCFLTIGAYGMRYISFEFENFRGIKKSKFELTQRGEEAQVLTLVGLNESGKTTILEAIDHFYPTLDGDQSVSPKTLMGWVAADPHQLIPISERTNFGGKITIKAVVELNSDDVIAIKEFVRAQANGFQVENLNDKIEISLSYSFENSRFKKKVTYWGGPLGTGFKKSGKTLRDISASQERDAFVALTQAIRSRLPKIWYFPNALFEFPDKIVLTETVDEKPTNKFYRFLFQDILDSLGKGLKVEDHVVRRARSSEEADKQALRQLLVEASREVTDSVVSAWGEIFDKGTIARKRVKIELVPRRVGIDLEADPVAIEFWLEDSDGTFAIGERSLGFRWFFVYLLITNYRGQKRSKESNMVFLFDEPASNLHSSAQGALLKSLAKMGNSATIVYTTHSHHLINPAWFSNTFVVVNEGSDPTKVTSDVTAQKTDIRIQRLNDFASQSPKRSYYFQPVLDVLDYRPSQLELIPSVVMVEGKTDYYILRYFCEIFNFENESDSLNFLPGTGASKFGHVIQLYMAWGRNFIILLDSDMEGSRAAKRYREDFGVFLDGRLIDLKEATSSPQTIAIESLFEDEDLLAFQALVSPVHTKFNKDIFARGVQFAFATSTRIELSVVAINNLTNLRNSLSSALAKKSDISNDEVIKKKQF
jgi:ABC-type cobalamin/Fe3+-siderophores transport system ATPase subunit/5S rRNA maturation endonuclease (ribonuclease M5)